MKVSTIVYIKSNENNQENDSLLKHVKVWRPTVSMFSGLAVQK